MTVEEMIKLLQKMPQHQSIKIVEDGSVYDWEPTRVYNDACKVYITNKESISVRKRNRVRRSISK